MKKNKIFSVLILISLFSFLNSCSTVPVTGRSQLNIIPSSQMLSMSFSQYDEFLKTNKLSRDKVKTALVKKVGHRIEKAVEKYMKQKGLSEKLKGYNWEFNLVENKQVNAWCMPGGKVVVYTGILPITKDENGLAVVLGHEIAHAIAEHGNERMSQGLLTNLGGYALSEALKEKPELTKNLAMTAFGIGSQVGLMLPFSRLHESEADHLGLIFMSIAGYNPNYAVEFWERMAKLKGNKPPEFLSTHPSDQTRINDIKKLLPKAMKHYKK